MVSAGYFFGSAHSRGENLLWIDLARAAIQHPIGTLLLQASELLQAKCRQCRFASASQGQAAQSKCLVRLNCCEQLGPYSSQHHRAGLNKSSLAPIIDSNNLQYWLIIRPILAQGP